MFAKRIFKEMFDREQDFYSILFQKQDFNEYLVYEEKVNVREKDFLKKLLFVDKISLESFFH